MQIRDWEFPDELHYDEHHQWARIEDGKVRIGLTSFGQYSRGDVLYIQLPELGVRVAAGDAVASIETGKWVGRVYSPCGGVIAEVNETLGDAPSQVNTAPYGSGWMFVVNEAVGGQRTSLMQGDDFRGWVELEIEEYLGAETGDESATKNIPSSR